MKGHYCYLVVADSWIIPGEQQAAVIVLFVSHAYTLITTRQNLYLKHKSAFMRIKWMNPRAIARFIFIDKVGSASMLTHGFHQYSAGTR